MDHAGAQTWLDSYVAAWLSYDADEIRALFTEDIAYRYHPSEDPIVGREAVVASWLGESDSDGASTRDAPGTYSARYAPIAVDDDVVVATGTSRYSERPDGAHCSHVRQLLCDAFRQRRAMPGVHRVLHSAALTLKPPGAR